MNQAQNRLSTDQSLDQNITDNTRNDVKPLVHATPHHSELPEVSNQLKVKVMLTSDHRAEDFIKDLKERNKPTYVYHKKRIAVALIGLLAAVGSLVWGFLS